MSIHSHSIPGRPVFFLIILVTLLGILDVGLFIHSRQQQDRLSNYSHLFDIATAGLGLTDLCVATEARYTRHPAVSDPVAPFMDHPGAFEHFPTGSFWAPPDNLRPAN
ncbi:MAG: hypothetical protein SCH71_14630 [Desulfobulbaceae bacterium]|nr:hypothetical protein [Desulfobulbaceae bacterium]